MTEITAVVPARSGSKRLPNKNEKILGGWPLFFWTLKACLEAPSISSVIFSTDSEHYWRLAVEKFGESRLRLDLRNREQSGDNVKIFDYLRGESDKLFGLDDSKARAFLLALPTAPFRNASHIEEAIALFRDTGKPIFSCTKYEFSPQFAFFINEMQWQPYGNENPMETGETRSQDQAELYRPNGAIYLRNVSDLANTDCETLYTSARPYLMGRLESTDIDDEIDFAFAEFLVEKGLIIQS